MDGLEEAKVRKAGAEPESQRVLGEGCLGPQSSQGSFGAEEGGWLQILEPGHILITEP